jgi:hypothetical protein
MSPTPPRRDRKIEIGAVVEVPTSRGFGYLQYTHWNDLMGALVRVLPGLHTLRPADLEALAREPEVYVTFVPLLEAINVGIFELVGRAEVPEGSRNFPLFRAAGPRAPGTGEPQSWWLWDGKTESRVRALSPEQKRLPVRSTIMPPVLIERLEAGWRPGDSAPAAISIGGAENKSREPELWHYLYFRDEQAARRAAEALSDEGMRTEVRLSARGSDWLVRASDTRAGTVEDVRDKLEKLASKLRGEYDGWEAG